MPVRAWKSTTSCRSGVEPLTDASGVPVVPGEPVSSWLEPLEPLTDASEVPGATSKKTRLSNGLSVAELLEPLEPSNLVMSDVCGVATALEMRAASRRRASLAIGFTPEDCRSNAIDAHSRMADDADSVGLVPFRCA